MLQRVATPFSVNVVAQIAADIALQHKYHVSISVKHVEI